VNIQISQRSVETAKPPASGYRILFDRKFSGFGIRITAAGAKSFVLNYRVHGRKRRFTIGSFPQWTADAARDEALQLCEGIRKGADPVHDKEVARGEPTVADLANDYIEQHAKPHKKASSVKQDRRMINTRGPGARLPESLGSRQARYREAAQLIADDALRG
jgi:Arm DNA-binding domain